MQASVPRTKRYCAHTQKTSLDVMGALKRGCKAPLNKKIPLSLLRERGKGRGYLKKNYFFPFFFPSAVIFIMNGITLKKAFIFLEVPCANMNFNASAIPSLLPASTG